MLSVRLWSDLGQPLHNPVREGLPTNQVHTDKPSRQYYDCAVAPQCNRLPKGNGSVGGTLSQVRHRSMSRQHSNNSDKKQKYDKDNRASDYLCRWCSCMQIRQGHTTVAKGDGKDADDHPQQQGELKAPLLQ
jgi:hypothetical protein